MNSERDSLIVFDFDGVISNSVHDSFRTSLNAYVDLLSEHGLPLSGPIDPPESVFEFEKGQFAIFESFRHLMPFGNRAEDYYVILQIIEQQKTSDVTDQRSYNDFKALLNPAVLEAYHQTFYRLRRQYQTDPETWSKLMPAFHGVIDAIKQLSERCMLAIATSKDRASIGIQLKSYGLESDFPSDRILDKEQSHSKRDHLKHFQKMFDLPFNQIHFIDDKALHLVDVADLGVQCHLATWGFNTPREHAIAREHGFHLLNLEDLAMLE